MRDSFLDHPARGAEKLYQAAPAVGYAPNAPAPAPQSPFTVAVEAFDAARTLASRVQTLADRVAGAVPRQGDAAATQQPNGVFDALRVEAEQVRWAVRDAWEALDRIEGSLP